MNLRVATFLASSLLTLTIAAPALAQSECAASASLDTRLAAALAKPDRPDKVKANDPVRDSENRFMLQYVRPGDHVLDLGAGGGYSTWLLSAAVCGGDVDSQNPSEWVSSPNAQAARTALAAARPNVHLVTSDFDKVPVPAKPYDVVFIGTIYHDTYNMPGADGVKLDQNLLATLKSGGLVVVIDHTAPAGSGITDTNTLHRIDKAKVLGDFKAAGFELVSDSPALANPADDHSLKVFDPAIRGHTDRMALVFKKP